MQVKYGILIYPFRVKLCENVVLDVGTICVLKNITLFWNCSKLVDITSIELTRKYYEKPPVKNAFFKYEKDY